NIEVIILSRPIKWRKVCGLPKTKRFGPLDIKFKEDNYIKLMVDEYETIRLIDVEGFSQEECGNQMNVARTTVQGIYARARKKIAKSLVNGKPLILEGGEYQLCEGLGDGCGRGCQRRQRGIKT